MSQSATLYRISQDTFRSLNQSNNTQRFDVDSAKSYSVFQGSFMALEYILSKGQYIPTTKIINEIFNPTQSLGEQDIEKLSPEEQMEFYEKGGFISYLDTTLISKLNNLLDTFSEVDIQSKYDPDELNDNGIYPEVWHNDNSPYEAFNQRHILEDFKELKQIIKKAEAEKDYIFVFVG